MQQQLSADHFNKKKLFSFLTYSTTTVTTTTTTTTNGQILSFSLFANRVLNVTHDPERNLNDFFSTPFNTIFYT